MKAIIKLAFELFKLLRIELKKAKKRKNEKEISDVKESIKKVDVNKLRDLILGPDRD